MQGRLTPNARLPRYIYWETLFDYAAPQPVSTLVALLAFTDFGSEFADLCIYLNNTDSTNSVSLIVETSHGGQRPTDSGTWVKPISAQKEDFVQISYPNPFTYVRISAATDGPAFPVVNVQWSIIGLRR